MLADTEISEVYWVEAVNTACYTQNRCLINKHHDKTPYELLVGRPPNIKHLKVFGCRCFVLNNGKEYLMTFLKRNSQKGKTSLWKERMTLTKKIMKCLVTTR